MGDTKVKQYPITHNFGPGMYEDLELLESSDKYTLKGLFRIYPSDGYEEIVEIDVSESIDAFHKEFPRKMFDIHGIDYTIDFVGHIKEFIAAVLIGYWWNEREEN